MRWLSAILDRVASHPAPAIDLEEVMRVRDAALDNADHPPADRQATRLRRLGVAPDYLRRVGERITAVDVS